MKRPPQPPLAADDVTGIVLCGGRGLRMSGADKPLTSFRNKPMIQQVLTRLRSQVGCCVVSANRNLAQYQRLADEVLPQHAPVAIVTDQLADYQGPLAGVHSALQQCKTPWFVVCPGDAPNLPHNLVDGLSKYRNPMSASVIHDGERQQHLHFLGHRAMLEPLGQYLHGGHRSVAGFHEANHAVSVRIGTAQDFANINRISR